MEESQKSSGSCQRSFESTQGAGPAYCISSMDRQTVERRRLVQGLLGWMLIASLPRAVRAGRPKPRYRATVAALRGASLVELQAHRRYFLFSERAISDEYPGIAYLFAALSTSELIHAQSYERVLFQLGLHKVEGPESTIPVQETKANLIYAVAREINTVDNFYPEILKEVKREKYADALAVVEYAWASHKQHRDMIAKIQRYSENHFEKVARRIDEKTARIFICQFCGSTLNHLPDETCPVCEYPAAHYRLIDPDQFRD